MQSRCGKEHRPHRPALVRHRGASHVRHRQLLARGFRPQCRVPQATQATSQLGDAGLSGNQILAKINAMLTQQTTLLAANDILWISGWLFVLLVVSVWFAKGPVGGAPAGVH